MVATYDFVVNNFFSANMIVTTTRIVDGMAMGTVFPLIGEYLSKYISFDILWVLVWLT
jgi:hypothetical protein